ncbi:hypothetical protein PT974_07041 [Cladobotryum mycophilum]|uniref:Chromatin assembly factor 1 subunit A n=1 Tax=Cladobotryum mycophilum TaxID=491253 RepID=A0ABR0SN76_9HYPO
MPLLEVSPNIQESESAGRKRSHDEFSGDLVKIDEAHDAKSSVTASIEASGSSLLSSVSDNARDFSPEGSPALTDAGSSTPSRPSPAPPTPTKTSPKTKSPTTQNPTSSTSNEPSTMTLSVKRKRLTDAEKEARDKEQAERKKEREEKAAIQAVKKAKQEEEKAARAKERDDKRKKKEEEQYRLQEEKERKLRAQQTLRDFFKRTEGQIVAKDKSSVDADSAAAPKQDSSAYTNMFKPFFVKEHTKLAPRQMSEKTQETKAKALDGYMANQKDKCPGFEPTKLFAPSKLYRRGRLYQPVKHIMEKAYRETQNSGTAGGVDANKIYGEVRTQLTKVPMKVISFSQDVRPPYYGTLTYKTFALGKGNMHRLARRSMSRRLPLDYDYDSEAEWQDEEGEDIDVDDDDEELDDEDDMDGFLDDSEDVGISRRVFGNTMEPESTGICFEDHNRLAPNPKSHEHKMEFMLESLEEQCGIDPFSTKYWQSEPKPVKTKQTKAAKSSEVETKMAPPPAPANAFAAIQGATGSGGGQAKLVKADLMNDFKQAILDNKVLSKVGIIDIIFHQFRDSVSRVEVKNTLEFVAEKKGAGRSKEWELKPGHEIVL